MPVFMGVAKQTCQGIKKELRVSGSSSEEVDVFYWTTIAALELVGEAGLGYSFSSFTGERNEYSIAIKSVIQIFTKVVPFMALIPFIYRIGTPLFRQWLLKYIPHKDLQRLRYAVGLQNAQAEEVLRAREALISSDSDLSSQASRGRDIVTLLMKAGEKAGPESGVNHQEMVGHMNTFIFAGHETTSSAVARILDILAHQPQIQVQLRAEIRQYFENDPSGTDYDGLLELPYLDGVVRETLRLYAPASFINRTCEKDAIISLAYPVETPSERLTSIPIKKGTRVFMSISVSNRDERIWGERASEFMPERWIGSKIDDITQPGSLVPGIYSSMMTFGAGPRACILAFFSEVMITELVKEFKFEPSQEKYQWETFNMQAPYLEKDPKDATRVPKLPLKVVQL
ncbi:unnamed protein product [Rhizoctonia solani]|nr:unnamed protein product [Rhizoctonia solani]